MTAEGILALFILVAIGGFYYGKTYSEVKLESVTRARTACLPSELDYIKPSLNFRCLNGLEGYVSYEDKE